MTDIRLSDLTFGTICRIAITLSTCFWIPVSLLLGIAGAMGALSIDGFQAADMHGIAGFFGGALQGIGCSIAMDVMLISGAAALAVARRLGGSGDFPLALRPVRRQDPAARK